MITDKDKLFFLNLFTGEPNATVVNDGTNIEQAVLKTKETATYQTNSLVYAVIELSVAAVLITFIHIYTCQLEKRKMLISTS